MSHVLEDLVDLLTLERSKRTCFAVVARTWGSASCSAARCSASHCRRPARPWSPKPIEVRPVTEKDPYNPQPADPIKYVWFRADGALADIPALHKYLLAYASDFGLLTTSMLPHGKSVWQKDMQVASLDHALWFHNDLRADDWLLYAICLLYTSPSPRDGLLSRMPSSA